MEKIPVKIKYKADDFIVEEIGDNWNCAISESPVFDNYPDLSRLDKNVVKDFIWCELEKVDLDHFQAIKDVAIRLNIFSQDIGYAGTKDKRAHTSQRISIFKPNLENIEKFRHPKIILKNFKWDKRKIKLGYLEGNRFKIVLRDIDKKDAMKVSSKIRSNAIFPNYFGAQRFGTQRGNNVKVGKLILKRKFKEAVMEILTGDSPNEREEFRTARKKLHDEKDFKEALKYFPMFLKVERQLLFHLARKDEDYVGAIKNADRKSILMFVNSVQSKIFNEILERSIEEDLDFTKEGQRNCMLFGYKSRFSNGRLGEIEKEILAENNIELNDFDVTEIPFLRMKGSFRKAITEVKELTISIEDDEEFSGAKKMKLSFVLPSGVYATTFLENFFEFVE